MHKGDRKKASQLPKVISRNRTRGSKEIGILYSD